MNQRIARLQQDARQPRLAMEADGQADTKTRERTEGAATAVQAMHGDSCSANRVDPGPKTTSISFAVRPNLPLSLVGATVWSRTALRRPSRVSHPWRCVQYRPASKKWKIDLRLSFLFSWENEHEFLKGAFLVLASNFVFPSIS